MTRAHLRHPAQDGFSSPTGEGLDLRPEQDADVPFLRRLYASTRWRELEPFGWPVAQKIAFLDSQFDAQRRHYRGVYAHATFSIVEQAGGSIGRLYVDVGDTALLVVDISLLPEVCGQGIGGALLRAVCARARATNRDVTLMVEVSNPAQRLYERLGFREADNDGVYRSLRWRAVVDT